MPTDYSSILALMMMTCAGVALKLELNTHISKKKIVKKRRPRRWWVRPIYQKRKEQGDYHNLMAEMRLSDHGLFFEYTRMKVQQFDELLTMVGPLITKRSNREPLNPEHRLAITLRFLATGCSQQTLAFQFRVGKSTVCNVLSETCSAIWDALKSKVFVEPSEDNWLKIANEFNDKWNFPHCIGAIDGKHVRIQSPSNTGTEYFNYKKFFSSVLLGMCDANYVFSIVDVGGMGSESDGGLFARSLLGKKLENDELRVPKPSKIGNTNFVCPYFVIGDEAFPLKNYLMRPYPGRHLVREFQIFNYRLARARRIIENAFGILVARWRIFQGTIIGKLENVEKYILAAVCLHNLLRLDEGSERVLGGYCPRNFADHVENGNLPLNKITSFYRAKNV